MSRPNSLGSTLCNYVYDQEFGQPFSLVALQELRETGRIRFILKSFGYSGQITHWHMVHKRSGKTFIMMA